MQTKYLFTAMIALAFVTIGCGADIDPKCSFIVDDDICDSCFDPDDGRTCKAQQKMLNHYLQQGLDPYEQKMLCAQFRNEWYGNCDACADRVSDVCTECKDPTEQNLCNAEFLQLQANLATQVFTTTTERNAYCRGNFLGSWSGRCELPDYCEHISKVCDYCEVTYTIGRNQEEIVDDDKTAALQDFCDQVIKDTYGEMVNRKACVEVWNAVSETCSYETLLSVKNSLSTASPSAE